MNKIRKKKENNKVERWKEEIQLTFSLHYDNSFRNKSLCKIMNFLWLNDRLV